VKRAQRERLAKELGCTEKTVSNWLLRGMPATILGAMQWHTAHINPSPKKGGKLPGAGRPLGSRDKEKRSGDKPEPALDRATRLGLLASGGLTKSQIDLTLDETRVIEAVRAAELLAGRQIAVEEVQLAWGELLQGHKADLDGLPGRIEGKAGSSLRLTPENGRKLREIVEAEVLEVFKRLLAGDWKKPR
jgi:hypothetical protein